jgi:hypothetical protein
VALQGRYGGLVIVQVRGWTVQTSRTRSLSGSAIIQDRVSELLDVRRAILAADPSFYLSDDEREATGADPDHLVGADQ